MIPDFHTVAGGVSGIVKRASVRRATGLCVGSPKGRAACQGTGDSLLPDPDDGSNQPIRATRSRNIVVAPLTLRSSSRATLRPRVFGVLQCRAAGGRLLLKTRTPVGSPIRRNLRKQAASMIRNISLALFGAYVVLGFIMIMLTVQ